MKVVFPLPLKVIALLCFYYTGVLTGYASPLDVDTSARAIVTTLGKLRGTTDGKVQVWRGIRYARAPKGDLRFRDPQPLEKWDGVTEATKFGTIAPQVESSLSKNEVSNEDCLFLNVWSPAADGKKRPVMFWIHGGAFAIGSGSSEMYNGADMAQKGDVVVVTINYRLGPLGFLYFNDLKGNTTGFDDNLGIKDQIAALKWVHDNIASFGGDPNAVTIFGESAGGSSVLTLMSAPAAKGLFARAIVQSASPRLTWDKALATTITKKYLEVLNVKPDNLEKLKMIPIDTLMKAVKVLDEYLKNQPTINKTFSPTVDGVLIPEGLLARSSDVPLLIGTNRNEANLFALPSIGLVPTKAKKLEKYFTMYTPQQVKKLTSAYRHYPRKKGVLDVATDVVFRYPAIQIAGRQAQSAPVYMYRFDWCSFPLKLAGLRAFHGLEIPFVFGNIHSGFAKKLSIMTKKKNVEGIARRMQQAWINFARTGNPNNQGENTWKQFSTADYPIMLFNSKDQFVCDPDQKQRLAWQELGY